mgnify:CR=1 FL=1
MDPRELLYKVLSDLGVDTRKVIVTEDPRTYFAECYEDYSGTYKVFKELEIDRLTSSGEEVCVTKKGTIYVLLTRPVNKNVVRHAGCHAYVFLNLGSSLMLRHAYIPASAGCDKKHVYAYEYSLRMLANMFSDILADLVCRRVYGDEYWTDVTKSVNRLIDTPLPIENMMMISLLKTLATMVYLEGGGPESVRRAIEAYYRIPSRETAIQLLSTLTTALEKLFGVNISIREAKLGSLDAIEMEVEPMILLCI